MKKPDNIPSRPQAPNPKMSQWRRLMAYRKDMFAAMPEKLYRAKLAEVKTPFYHSFLANDPNVQSYILESPETQFPKSPSVYGSLEALLKDGIFITGGDQWSFQRRIIDPAFKGGRIKIAYPEMQKACGNFLARLKAKDLNAPLEMEFECSYFASDVIFRTMFSKPIEHDLAREIFENFQIYQRAQPVWNFPNLLRMPKWVPRLYSPKGQRAARKIQRAIGIIVDERLAEIERQEAPDDLVTNILTRTDPETGQRFTRSEMIGNVATFFIAGHETSASALAWALYLLCFAPEEQDKIWQEVKNLDTMNLSFSEVHQLPQIRKVLAETLRLYPPVPMLVREATQQEEFRDRKVNPGDWCVTSPWFSGRHQEIWDDPDAFKPERWDEMPEHCRQAYFPFSKGPRICTGIGFAQTELYLALANLVRNFEFSLAGDAPVPVAHLTVRSQSGVHLRLKPRAEIGKDI